jgi:hypothetical protein
MYLGKLNLTRTPALAALECVTETRETYRESHQAATLIFFKKRTNCAFIYFIHFIIQYSCKYVIYYYFINDLKMSLFLNFIFFIEKSQL